MKKIILACLLCSSHLSFAASDYQLILDPNFSPYSGAEDILTFQHLLMKGEDDLIHRPPAKISVARGVGRFFELAAWDVVNRYLLFTQHEVFGHGYRIRDLGSKYAAVVGYSFKWSSAATEYVLSDQLTSSQQLSIITAGIDATAILANRLRFKWLEAGAIDGRQSSLYLAAEQDLTNYVYTMDFTSGDLSLSGHDIEGYLFFLNATYPGGHLTKSKLRNMTLINYLDPFTFYSWYSSWRFIVSGKQTRIPMIRMGQYKYLPSLRLGLTPFGPEFFLENFLSCEEHPIYFYIKAGSFAQNDYYGIGVEQPYLFSWKKLNIGYRFDAWRQPQVIFQKGYLQAFDLYSFPNAESVPQFYSNATLHKQTVGIALSAIIEKELDESAHLYLQPGFKTKGYLPGEALRASPILRIGFSQLF